MKYEPRPGPCGHDELRLDCECGQLVATWWREVLRRTAESHAAGHLIPDTVALVSTAKETGDQVAETVVLPSATAEQERRTA